MSEMKIKAPVPIEADAYKSAEGILTVQDSAGNTYENRSDGVYKKDAKPGSSFVKLCDALELVAHTRTVEGNDWGMWIKFKDADGTPHDLVLPRKLLTQGRRVEELLQASGLHVYVLSGNSGKCPLAEFLNAVPMDALPRAVSVTRGGFVSDAFDCFVFGDNQVLSLPGAERVTPTSADCAAVLTEKGTLEEWQANVATPALHSKRMMFALSVALAAPLLQILDLPCKTFHLNGTSGDGKTSIMKAAASVNGGEERVTGWDKTKNGFEAVAAQHNNQLLVIDEIGQGDIAALDKIAYQLDNGVGRDRMTRNATLRKAARWSLIALSAGEFSLSEMKRQKSHNGRAHTATGERVRFICIPCDAGQGLGVLDSLPGGVTDDKAANDAKRVALLARVSSFKATGVAGRKYLMELMQDVWDNGREALKEQYREFEEEFIARVGRGGLAPTERRVIRHFAAVAFAGELGIAYGVFGTEWQENDALEAAIACFEAWRTSDESPERHREKVIELMLEAPFAYGAEFLKFEYPLGGSCVSFVWEPNRTPLGRLVLRNKDNAASWIAAIFLRQEFEELLRRVGDGESKADVVEKLIELGCLVLPEKRKKDGERKEPDRKGQIQPKANNALGLGRSARVYVLVPRDDEGAKRIARNII